MRTIRYGEEQGPFIIHDANNGLIHFPSFPSRRLANPLTIYDNADDNGTQ